MIITASIIITASANPSFLLPSLLGFVVLLHREHWLLVNDHGVFFHGPDREAFVHYRLYFLLLSVWLDRAEVVNPPVRQEFIRLLV